MTTTPQSTTRATPVTRRSRSDGPWAWVAKAVVTKYGPMLGLQPLAVYLALAAYAWNEVVNIIPAATIARDLGVSPDTVRRGLRKLVDAGLVHVERGAPGKPNRMTLCTLAHTQGNVPQECGQGSAPVQNPPRTVAEGGYAPVPTHIQEYENNKNLFEKGNTHPSGSHRCIGTNCEHDQRGWAIIGNVLRRKYGAEDQVLRAYLSRPASNDTAPADPPENLEQSSKPLVAAPQMEEREPRPAARPSLPADPTAIR